MDDRVALPLFGMGWRQAMHRDGSKILALGEPHEPELGTTDTRRIRQHGVEHRLQLTWRAGDDLKDLRGRGLLLQRFAQLIEQPHILHGDHRLVCERLDQLDLLVGERLYGIVRESDYPDWVSLAHQRYAEQGAAAPDFLRGGE